MQDRKIRIPRDVERHFAKKRAVHVASFALIEAVLIVIAVLYGDDIFGGKWGFAVAVYALIMVLPAYKLRVIFWLTDKSWAGEIVGRSEEDYLSVDRSLGRRGGIVTNKIQRFQIKLDSGKIIEYTVYDDRARHAFRHKTYNVGDRVIHVAGSNYLQAVAVGEDDTLICVVCGSESRAEMPLCPVCGKSLKID